MILSQFAAEFISVSIFRSYHNLKIKDLLADIFRLAAIQFNLMNNFRIFFDTFNYEIIAGS